MTMQASELRELRRRMGLTQEQLAQEIGMSRKTINAMELGKSVIERRTELAVRYLEHLGASKA
uniref:helix-turn-helix transcriptional regulator n=1 Tax=uncultured Sphingomonas sp. TaxID=158754 RepID=UPI0035CB0BC6